MQEPLRFSHHMVDTVRAYSLSGLVSNDEIARTLRNRYDPRITALDVARWRRQYHRFEIACSCALDDANAEMTGLVLDAARKGDIPTARWWLERRNPAFMPKSKTEFSGENLDDLLRQRAASEVELRERGLIEDRDETAPGG